MTTPSGLRLKMLSAIGVRRRGGRAVELLNYLPEAEAEAAGELMQGYAAQPDRDYALEQMIRQYPDQWSWMHRRWKAVPREGEV